MDDEPAIFLRYRGGQGRHPFLAETNDLKEKAVRFILHSRAPEVPGQRKKALSHGSVTVGFGAVAHGAIEGIVLFSPIDGICSKGKRILQIPGVHHLKDMIASMDGNRILWHFRKKRFMWAYGGRLPHSPRLKMIVDKYETTVSEEDEQR